MALPKLNNNPKYKCTVPSSKEVVTYRPYLVKEEKVLMIAFETGDQKQALGAIVDTLDACIDGDQNVGDLTTFDVEYLFTQIRSKSVGETSKILVPCGACNHKNEVSVNLADIEVKFKEDFTDRVQITDEITIEMKYPTYSQVINMDFEGDQTAMGMDILCNSISAIMTEEERTDCKDIKQEEIQEFLDSMTSEQFGKLSAFVETLPSLEKDLKVPCESCGETIERTLKGISDFLS